MFAAVQLGHLIWRVPEAIVPDVDARLATRGWLASHGPKAPDRRGSAAPTAGHRGPVRADRKHQGRGSCRRVTAAMQRNESGRVSEAVTLWPGCSTPMSPNSSCSRRHPTLPWERGQDGGRPPEHHLTLLDPGQIRVKPDDDRCIAAGPSLTDAVEEHRPLPVESLRVLVAGLAKGLARSMLLSWCTWT